MPDKPPSVLSRQFLPASIAIFATAALASFQALGIAAALPDIAADLSNVSLLPWAITSFLLTSSIATVIAGPFVDSVGVRRVFQIAVIVFVVMGFASAFAPSMEVLVALRAMQGVGAGLVLSSGNAAVSLVYPEHMVGRAFAANATVWGVMGVMGPAIAAAILTFLSWQWIFYVNLPLGLMALFAGLRVFPGPFGEKEGRVDVLGALLVAAFTVGTLFAVEALGVVSFVWLAGVVTVIVIYGWHARRTPSPLVKLEHVIAQPYLGLGAATGLMLTGTFAVNSYMPLFVRAGKEASAAVTAWSILPITTGWTIGALVSSRMADRHSESWIAVVGFLCNVPALIAVWLLVVTDASLALIFGALFVAGIGVGMTTNASLTLLRAVTANAQIGRVNAAHLFARNQGFTYGAAIGGAVMLFVINNQIGDVELVRELITSRDSAPPPGAASAVKDGFAASVGVGAVASAIGMFAAIRMRQFLREQREAKRGV